MFSRFLCLGSAVIVIATTGVVLARIEAGNGGSEHLDYGKFQEGRRLFEHETFGGNGRTCQTYHGSLTGTVSPEDAQRRFAENKRDPLFLHDGSDDGSGHGVDRMLKDATVLVKID